LELFFDTRIISTKSKVEKNEHHQMLSPHQMGKDQGNLLTIHKMIILSTLRYEEEANGSAPKVVLKLHEPIHIRIRLTLGVFAVCRTENALCEAEVFILADMRNLNTTITAIRFISKPNHSIRPYCLNPNELDEYAQRPAAPKPFFVRAMEHLGKLQIDTRKIERSPPQYFRPPWTNIDHNRFDYELSAKQRGASNERYQAENFRKIRTLQQNIHRRIEKSRKGWMRSSPERQHNKKKTISTKLDLQRRAISPIYSNSPTTTKI
jgi:hypothetical protein